MTDPVVLLGTQSNGETLPVQVNEFGQLVAEGLPGAEGPPGPEGPPGGDFPLPEDPYEGALLGWMNGGLAWVGTPPVPIPDDVFGPILELERDWIVVEGDVPAEIGNGVYVWQVLPDGTKYSLGYNVSERWTGLLTGNYEISSPIDGFDGSTATVATCWDGVFNQAPPAGFYEMTLDFSDVPLDGPVDVYAAMAPQSPYFGRFVVDTGTGYGNDIPANQNGWTTVASGSQKVYGLKVRATQNGCSFNAIRSKSVMLLDPSLSANFRVQSVAGNTLVGTYNDITMFEAGKYLRTYEQRVAPWVLYGNDPTSLIDHLRSS